MGGMQTILALLAVTLFSSMTLGSYNNLTSQGDILYSSYLNLLGQNEADAFFEKLNIKVIKDKSYTIDKLYNDYHNINDTVTLPDLPNGSSIITFQRHITSSYCTKDGTTSPTPTDFVKISLNMTSSYGNRMIYVGTTSNPIIRVFTSSGL